MNNIIDCMSCKHLKALSIDIKNIPRKIKIVRDCGKNIKAIPYITIELNPNIKQKISCKEFELGNKTMIDELNKSIRSEK